MSRRQRSPGQDRQHLAPRRQRQIKVRFSDQEYDLLAAAAPTSGLTTSGFIAEAALAVTRRQRCNPGQEREALRELIAARAQLRRYGNNINQAVRALNSLGQAPPWLLDAMRLTDQAVRRIDHAAERLAHPTGVSAPRSAPATARKGSRPSPSPADTTSGGLR